MEIRKVDNSKEIKAFLKLPTRLYKGDKNWIRPLDPDIEEVFDAEKNPLIRKSKAVAQRWNLYDNGVIVGRIAAFINPQTQDETNSEGTKFKVGGVGFFESENNQQYADKLFEVSFDWLSEQGVQVIDGPINLGDRDNWWGILIDGHDIEPNYKVPWTKPYYQQLFENYGWNLYFRQITFGRKVNDALHPAYVRIAERLFEDKDLDFRIIDLKKLDDFTQDFCTIYNKAWGGHHGVKELTYAQAKSRMEQMKLIVDPKIVYFAYHKDEPIGFYINIPELNQVVKHIKNGKLNLMGKLKFLWHLKIAKTNSKMMGIAFGVVPEFQRKGIMAGIVEYCRRFVQESIRGRYIDFEMNWIGEFNKPMMKICAGLGEPIKTHHTYRFMLDKSLPFEKMKEIELKAKE